MICLAASCPALASRTPRFSAVGSTESTPSTNGSVRPEVDLGVVGPAELDHDDRLVRVRFLPGRRHLRAHLERDAGLVAASRRDARVRDRAEERGHDDARIEGVVHAGRGGLGIPDVQRRAVEAAGDRPGRCSGSSRPSPPGHRRPRPRRRTSPAAYRCASAAWAWWNTFDRSDTKNAIRLASVSGGGDAACGQRPHEASSPVVNRVFRFILSPSPAERATRCDGPPRCELLTSGLSSTLCRFSQRAKILSVA